MTVVVMIIKKPKLTLVFRFQTPWNILEMCKNWWKKISLCCYLLCYNGFQHIVFDLSLKIYNLSYCDSILNVKSILEYKENKVLIYVLYSYYEPWCLAQNTDKNLMKKQYIHTRIRIYVYKIIMKTISKSNTNQFNSKSNKN